jgi:ribosomal protein S6--L-glutamate ligase
MDSTERLVVLTRQPDSPGALRLSEAARAGSVPLELVDPHELYLHLEQPADELARVVSPRLGDNWPGTAVIPRLGSLSTEYALSALEALVRAGARSLNGPAGLWRLRYRFRALTELAAAGLPVPQTAMLRAPSDVEPAVEQLGGYPVVVKFLRGSQGLGVVLARDRATVESVLEALNLVQYDVMLQRFYPAGAKSDLRVLVLGGQPRWAVRRHAPPGGFRANYHRGGRAEAIELVPRLAELACRAAACFELGLAGVDFIEQDGRALIMEVNGSPGFQTIEECHGVDVAGAIIARALEL